MKSQQTVTSFGAPHYPYSRRRKVLVVDDEPSISNLLYLLLEGLNYEGEFVWSAKRALEMIERESFDAVFLDLRHSDISAEQIASKMIHICPDLAGRVLIVRGEDVRPPRREPLGCYRLQIRQDRIMVDLQRCLHALWPSPLLAPAA